MLRPTGRVSAGVCRMIDVWRVLATAWIIVCALREDVAGAAAFIPGNLVVVRIGNGITPPGANLANPVFLDEYTPSGALVQTIPLPGTGADKLTLPNTGSIGFLTRSQDGFYFTLGGYSADLGTNGVVSSSSATTPRVICRISATGTVDLSTKLTGAYSGSGSTFRSVVTDDGNRYWTGGGAINMANFPGIRFTTPHGTDSSLQITAGVSDHRAIDIYNGQLYASSAITTIRGVGTVGTGLPTTGGQTYTPLPGFPTSLINSADFYFAGPDVLYVCDTRAPPDGGIQKWIRMDGPTWFLAYTMKVGLTSGCYGLTANPGEFPVRLYATTANGAQLVTVVDNGGGADLFTVLATTTNNAVFRGVRKHGPSPFSCNSTGGLYFVSVNVSGPSLVECAPPGGSMQEFNAQVSRTGLTCETIGSLDWYVDGNYVTTQHQSYCPGCPPIYCTHFQVDYSLLINLTPGMHIVKAVADADPPVVPGACSAMMVKIFQSEDGTGACCMPDESCLITTQSLCLLAGGVFHGVCSTCPTTPLCGGEGDANDDGAINGDDITCFIGCLDNPASPGPGCDCTSADTDSDGDIDAEDIRNFACIALNLWPDCP